MSQRLCSLPILAERDRARACRRATSKGLCWDRLRTFLASRPDVGGALAPLDLDAANFEAALTRASELSRRWLAMPPSDIAALVRRIAERVEVDVDAIALRLDRRMLAAELTGDNRANGGNADPILLAIDAVLKRAGKGKRLIIEDGAGAEVNPDLVALLREAFSLRDQLMSGSEESIESMSRRLGMNKARLTSLVRLSYLSPEIVHSILEGRQPIELTPTGLLKLSKDLPKDWGEQRRFLGFPG
jgi:site-specific DNA recombinase